MESASARSGPPSGSRQFPDEASASGELQLLPVLAAGGDLEVSLAHPGPGRQRVGAATLVVVVPGVVAGPVVTVVVVDVVAGAIVTVVIAHVVAGAIVTV